MEVIYKNAKPFGGTYYGMPFKFFRQNIGGNKFGYVANLNNGFQIAHSGNYLVAVFENTDTPTIYDMNPNKKQSLNGLVEGVLRD